MAIYMDFSGTEGAIGFISDGEPVIPVGVKLYPSKEAAKADYLITDVVDTPEYKELLRLTQEA